MADKGGQQSDEEPKNPMTKEDASRIQSSYAKQYGGEVDKGSFPARAQAAADKRENKNKEEGGQQSGEETKNPSEFSTRMDKEGGQKTGGEPKNPMTKEAAARIQSSEAKKHGGGVEKGSFPSRAQSTADKRENQKNN